ncbi:HAD-IA family hydrolase [Actinomycetospora sp. TBRC 11914]|uniref:HAD-IA family hydrolase n=1 Tax=Actinomycetospora sp. TBRC 11914 TaxID=2729387 RepID=UPI00145D05EE|nr:HAD-IA family hydrolase [Actinomycetospora sp. TBRC 11914]NMO88407.1 HAD-IA family hydrolase [Actinomycetospora sp. TBRC 11914]
MPAPSALLLGSISSVVDTSELQRRAFNDAFSHHGLDWEWDRERYAAMLTSNGGRDRIAEYARSTGESVDADAVHATKSRIFQQLLGASTLHPRPGVAETVRAAHEQGLRVGLVTSTSKENVAALLEAVRDDLAAGEFDVVVDSSRVERTKPDPAAYTVALDELGLSAGQCVAVEDNPGGVEAAAAAEVPCVAFPNENTASADFGAALARVEALDLAQLRDLVENR